MNKLQNTALFLAGVGYVTAFAAYKVGISYLAWFWVCIVVAAVAFLSSGVIAGTIVRRWKPLVALVASVAGVILFGIYIVIMLSIPHRP